jgi:hypothetical protein
MPLYVINNSRGFQRRIRAALGFHGLRRKEHHPGLKDRGIQEGVL